MIVAQTFAPADEELRKAIAHTEEFVRGQLGDARLFGIDSSESRKPKLEVLRQPISKA